MRGLPKALHLPSGVEGGRSPAVYVVPEPPTTVIAFVQYCKQWVIGSLSFDLSKQMFV